MEGAFAVIAVQADNGLKYYKTMQPLPLQHGHFMMCFEGREFTMQYTSQNELAVYACLNMGEAYAPDGMPAGQSA